MPDAARLSDQAPVDAARRAGTDGVIVLGDPAPSAPRGAGPPDAAHHEAGRGGRAAGAAGGATPARTPPDASVPATALLERLSTGAALIDADGLLRWCNAAFAELRGVPMAHLVGRSVTALHEAGDNPYATADALRLDRDPGAEYRFTRTVAGQPVLHVLRVLPGEDTAGHPGPQRWFVLETLPLDAGPAHRPGPPMHAGPFPEALVTPDGEIVVANEAFARMVGERRHRLPGTRLADLVDPADQPVLREALAEVGGAVGGTGGTDEPDDATAVEVHLARNDSRPSWAELALVATGATGGADADAGGTGRAGADAVPLVAVRARDVTDRKRDELLLAEVFDASPSPYALVGTDGRIHSTNPAWRHAFGPHTVGGNLIELVGGEDRARLTEAIDRCRGAGADACELTVVVDDLERAPFLARVRATPLHDLGHRTERLLVGVDDLTEHAIEVESARRSAAVARSCIDEVDVAVTVHDAEGTVRELNLGAHRLFGADATELVGHAALPTWWQPHRPDGAPLAEDDHPVHRVLHGATTAAEAVIGLRIGRGERGERRRWFLVRARAVRDDALRHRVGAVATYSDITALQHELGTARDERSAATDAFEVLPVPAYRTGADLVPVRVSAALRRLVEALRTPAPGSTAAGVDGEPVAAGASPGNSDDAGRDDDVVVDLTRDPPTTFDRTRRTLRVTPPTDLAPGAAPRHPAAPDDGAAVTDLFALVHRDDRRVAADALAEAARRRATVRVQHRLASEHGTQWVDHQITPLLNGDEIEGFVGVLIPLPEWVAQGDRTRRLVRLVETANELVGEFELDSGRVTYLNPRAQQTFEVPDHHLEHLMLTELYGEDDERVFLAEIWPALLEHSQWDGELPMRTLGGATLHVQQWITAEWEDGRIVRLVAVGHDVTDRSRREAELAERASRDGLTGLANRARLLESVELALTRARRSERLVALAFLDLDRFKQVNDRFGHEAGDQLLVQVAERLRSVVRPSDLVARLGGDEFVVLCDTVEDRPQALGMAHRVANALSANPYALAGATVRITCSVGVALSRGAEDPEGLLRNADAALYRAKETGRHRIALFDESMRNRVGDKEALTEELRGALAAGQIAVHYEPAADLRTGAVGAVAALARWEHPTRGPLADAALWDAAEGTPLLSALGEQVLAEATSRARAWQLRLGRGAPSLHVGVASQQVADGSVVDSVRAALRRTGLRPELLCLELDEAVLLEDSERAIGTLRDLKALGVRLAIAGFGTGYSSLSYLSRLPVDVVKIDRSFVQELDADRPASAVVAGAIVSLAHALGLATLAEGVTGAGQLQELRRLGCDAATGPQVAAPLAGDAIDAYLGERRDRAAEADGSGPDRPNLGR